MRPGFSVSAAFGAVASSYGLVSARITPLCQVGSGWATANAAGSRLRADAFKIGNRVPQMACEALARAREQLIRARVPRWIPGLDPQTATDPALGNVMFRSRREDIGECYPQ